MNPYLTKLRAQIETLPKHHGVYLFYASQHDELPLYVGKSCNIQQRVKSHCYNATKQSREAKLMKQVKHIEFKMTAGDIGALLLEATLIKQYLPVYNCRLRRLRYVYYYELQTQDALFKIALRRSNVAQFQTDTVCFGLFSSQRQAQQILLDICQHEKLCAQSLQLTTGKGYCFNYQLKQCLGVCAGKESVQDHNQRLLLALAKLKQQHWPYKNIIGIIEENKSSGLREIHYVDQWRYLASKALAPNEQPTRITDLKNVNFDRDHYKILLAALTKSTSTPINLVEFEYC